MKCCNLCGAPIRTESWHLIALEDARKLMSDIANGKVNEADEAEKWLRAYGWPNDQTLPTEGAAQKP